VQRPAVRKPRLANLPAEVRGRITRCAHNVTLSLAVLPRPFRRPLGNLAREARHSSWPPATCLSGSATLPRITGRNAPDPPLRGPSMPFPMAPLVARNRMMSVGASTGPRRRFLPADAEQVDARPGGRWWRLPAAQPWARSASSPPSPSCPPTAAGGAADARAAASAGAARLAAVARRVRGPAGVRRHCMSSCRRSASIASRRWVIAPAWSLSRSCSARTCRTD
jgi:hypothetical protein